MYSWSDISLLRVKVTLFLKWVIQRIISETALWYHFLMPQGEKITDYIQEMSYILCHWNENRQACGEWVSESCPVVSNSATPR